MISGITRIVATVTLLLGAGGAAATGTETWEFEVRLDDRKIGYHRFDLGHEGGRQVLQTEASFDVKVLFINAFRYRHRNTEIWQNGCLASIDAVTDNNGDDLFVRGEQTGERFTLASGSEPAELDGCVQTFAYWNPAILEARRLLNSQTGEYESVAIELDGEDTVSVEGQPVAALRYSLETQGGDITLWYSKDDSRWLALEAPARGDRKIRYLPKRVPDNAPEGVLVADNT